MDFEVKRMEPLFKDEADYQAFLDRHNKHKVKRGDLASYAGRLLSWASMPAPPPPR
ncbi:MAG: hypothetical protein ACLTLQ_13795 [[Clostridium] scindens]